MTPERFARISNVLDRRQPDLTVITDEVHKPRNISAITRSCDAVGVVAIHSVMPELGYQIYSAGTSASANKWVEAFHYSAVSEPIEKLREQNHQIVAATLGDKTIDYRQIDYTRPTAILLGAEVKGVSSDALAGVDATISLPMVGMVESYNVSVASALILSEAFRQREEAGMYSRRRLSPEVYQALFFRWAHPKLAEYCDNYNIPYPALREDGEVEGLSEWYAHVREVYGSS